MKRHKNDIVSTRVHWVYERIYIVLRGTVFMNFKINFHFGKDVRGSYFKYDE